MGCADRCHFIPPYLLRHLAAAAPAQVSAGSRSTLLVDDVLRERRLARPPVRTAVAEAGRFVVHSADNTEDLPGRPVRFDGDAPSGDERVDDAYGGTAATLDMFEEVFGRASVDGAGSAVSVTVHYGTAYVNAFWDGAQLVFGDGDGVVFGPFTRPIDVLAHEFTHGVTQFSAGLTYRGQSGALNESVSDVFASLVKQRVAGETADAADWLIGAGIFLPHVQGRALRSMKEPGTAYDDPRLGTDPQVGSMAAYVETTDDNGGVHINSGIPNRAFHLTATAIGGHSWEAPGRIWYDTLTGGQILPSANFEAFATATIQSASRLYGAGSAEADAVRAAWSTVGVGRAPRRDLAASGVAASEPSGASVSASPVSRVSVRCTGGFAGLSRSASMDVRSDPAGPAVAALLSRIDYTSLIGWTPMPDRLVYTVEVDDERFDVPEQAMPPELSEVVRLVLGDQIV